MILLLIHRLTKTSMTRRLAMKRNESTTWVSHPSRFAVMAMAIIIVTLAWPVLALAANESRSAGKEWLKRDYHYVVIDQDVRDVLTEFGRNLSLPIEISRQVRGRVRGDIQGGNAEEFLDQIVAANGLAWYFDGGVLYVTSRSEITQRTLDLQGVDSAKLTHDLERWRVGEPLTARLVDGGSAIQAVGPASWVESVAQRIQALRQSPPTGTGEVRVFRGSVSTQSQSGN